MSRERFPVANATLQFPGSAIGVAIAAALALALALAAPAVADVITFDDVSFTPTGNGSGRQFRSVVSGGFVFTADSFHLIANPSLCGLGGCVDNGTQYATSDPPFNSGPVNFGGPVSMARTDGGVFTLRAFDGAGLLLDWFQGSADGVWVVGHLPGGGILQTGWNLGQSPAFKTFSFDSAWTGLVSVDWSGFHMSQPGYLAFDNIVVEQSVPEPASLVLLGTGVGVIALAMWRRRI